MKNLWTSMRNMPLKARWAVGIWAVAWVNFLHHIYRLTHDGGWVAKSAVAVALLTFFLLRGQNWSRMIALMAAGMAILFLSFLAYILRGVALEAALSLFGMMMFGVAAYLLFHPETAGFFKSMSKPENSSKPDEEKGR
jgi:hypothetical protein